MTQQYLSGELSLLLARLQTAATDRASMRDIANLRYMAETEPLAALTSVVARALALSDALCWGSLQRGDPAAFANQAVVGAELRNFAVCAGFLQEDDPI